MATRIRIPRPATRNPLTELEFEYCDGGRAEAGRRPSRDCVVRAISVALAFVDHDNLYGNFPYLEVYNLLANRNKEDGWRYDWNVGRSARNGNIEDIWKPLVRELGFEGRWFSGFHARPNLGNAYDELGDCICAIDRHMCAVIGGAVWDTWDSRWHHERGVPQKGWSNTVRSMFTLPKHIGPFLELAPPID